MRRVRLAVVVVAEHRYTAERCAAGNEVFDGQYEYSYDAWNHVTVGARAYPTGTNTCTTGSVIATMEYDAMGRRTQKVVENSADWDGTTTAYWNGWSDVEERNASGQVIKQQVWGARYIDELVQVGINTDPGQDDDTVAAGTQDNCDEFYYAMQDGNWNVVGLVSTAGSLVERYEFTAYGQRTVAAIGDPVPRNDREPEAAGMGGMGQGPDACDCEALDDGRIAVAAWWRKPVKQINP